MNREADPGQLAADPGQMTQGLPFQSSNPLIVWLWQQGWALPTLPELTRGLGLAMQGAGLAVFRLRLTLRTLHPELAGLSHTWRADTNEVEEFWPPLSVLREALFLQSPYALIFDGAGGIRRRLDIPGAPLDFPILEELQAEGATDYVALPVVSSDGRINAMTITSRRPGGFTTAGLRMVTDMIPMLARLTEVHALRRTAKTVLQTYLGRQTGERVLEGLIHRGDGQEIHAVIWLCDLRGSTRLADTMPRQAFLDLLNEYFECMAGAVMAHDGEVLKFIGDALLAIFPIGAASEHPETCSRHRLASIAALAAAREAMQRMEALNRARHDRAQPPLAFGIALHLGDVMYGNIGAPGRLDFTVIGPAANEAARLEAMCKTLGRPIVISSQFARVLPEKLLSLGFHALRGVHEPNELFTLPDVPPAP